MNYIHARRFKRILLVLSVKVAFTLLLPWIRRHEDFYRFTRIMCSCTLLPSYAKMPSLLPYPHPMGRSELIFERAAGEEISHVTANLYITQYHYIRVVIVLHERCMRCIFDRMLSDSPLQDAH